MSQKATRESRVSIGTTLVTLVLIILVPMYALIAVLFFQLHDDERDALRQRTAATASAMAGGIARQLQDMEVALKILATAPELEAGDLASFHDRTSDGMRSGSWYLLVVGEDGQQKLNTRVPFGAELGKTSHMLSLQRALSTGKVEISDVFFGRTEQRWAFNVILPLDDALSSIGRALILTQDADDLHALLSTETLPQGWHVAIIDGSNNVIISTDDSSPDKPLAAYPDLPVDLLTGPIEAPYAKPGEILGVSSVGGSRWKAVVWGPVATTESHITSVLWQLVLVGLTALLLSCALAYLFGRHLRQSVVGVAEMARRLGEGEVVSPLNSRIREVETVATALTNASYERRQAEDQLRMLLTELRHRTKNLLAVALGIVQVSGRHSGSADEIKDAIAERLKGLAQSVELLIEDNWSGIPLSRLVRRHLAAFVNADSQIEIEGKEIFVKPEAVQNLGMVFHELATNAVKYGALSVQDGKVHVGWKQAASGPDDEMLEITWAETGSPTPSGHRQPGTGSRLVEHISSGFGGSSSLHVEKDGIRWTMTIPLSAIQEREAVDPD